MPAAIRVQLGDALAVRDDMPATAALRRNLTRAARLALRSQGVKSAELSVTLLDDAAIADLNQRFLSHEGPTDVISFALYEDGEAPVGDIYVGYDQAVRQAAANAVPLDEELVRLTVHGVLHVLGFDHPDGDDRLDSEMWQLQERIVTDALTA